MNHPDNGERVRSLLCDREALTKPSGMEGFIAKGGRIYRGLISTQ